MTQLFSVLFLLNVDWSDDVLVRAATCGSKLQPHKVNEECCEVGAGEGGDEDGEDVRKPRWWRDYVG